MIGALTGLVRSTGEKVVTLDVSGVHFLLTTPRPEEFAVGSTTTITTHLHWNQDRGPHLLGFVSEQEKTVFLMVLDCPKIGPSIAIQMLSQVPAEQLIALLAAQDEKALSKINGIGPKKAEQVVTYLKEKAQKLIQTGAVKSANPEQASYGQLADTLQALGYSKGEITQALSILGTESGLSFDQQLRKALGVLSKAHL